jgi:hypothetical protein
MPPVHDFNPTRSVTVLVTRRFDNLGGAPKNTFMGVHAIIQLTSTTDERLELWSCMRAELVPCHCQSLSKFSSAEHEGPRGTQILH